MNNLTISHNEKAIQEIKHPMPCPIVSGEMLTDTQRSRFDYLADIDTAKFAIYNDDAYLLSEIIKFSPESPEYTAGYHGYQLDNFESVLFKFSAGGDAVSCATYNP